MREHSLTCPQLILKMLACYDEPLWKKTCLSGVVVEQALNLTSYISLHNQCEFHSGLFNM